MSESEKIKIGNCRNCDRDVFRGENIRRGSKLVVVDTIFGKRQRNLAVPICTDCTAASLAELRERAESETATFADQRWYRINLLDQTVPCGGCGGKIGNLSGRDEANIRLGRNSYCSEICQRAYISEKNRRPKIETGCEHCGETFVKPRSEARFCSSRCRVAAHRARKKSESPGTPA